MINEEIRRKLRELNMGEFVKRLELQQSESATITLSFDERLQRLIAGAKLRFHIHHLLHSIQEKSMSFTQINSRFFRRGECM